MMGILVTALQWLSVALLQGLSVVPQKPSQADTVAAEIAVFVLAPWPDRQVSFALEHELLPSSQAIIPLSSISKPVMCVRAASLSNITYRCRTALERDRLVAEHVASAWTEVVSKHFRSSDSVQLLNQAGLERRVAFPDLMRFIGQYYLVEHSLTVREQGGTRIVEFQDDSIVVEQDDESQRGGLTD